MKSKSISNLSNEKRALAHVTHFIKVISPLKCNMKFISILTGAPPVVVLLFAFLAFVHDKIMNNSIM